MEHEWSDKELTSVAGLPLPLELVIFFGTIVPNTLSPLLQLWLMQPLLLIIVLLSFACLS